MLLTMKALTAGGARDLLLTARGHRSRAARAKTPRRARAAVERASLLTPVAKAFSTDIGVEVASLGVQVHGGMGFIEETGAAQHLRDARIAPIYEGTNGIQAIDLVTRKLPLSDGQAVAALIAGMRATAQKLVGINSPAFGQMAARCATPSRRSTARRNTCSAPCATHRGTRLPAPRPIFASSALRKARPRSPRSRLRRMRQARDGDSDPAHAGRIGLARFFAENIATGATGLEAAITAGGASVHDAALGARLLSLAAGRPLGGRTGLVAGGSRGVGRGIALALGEAGARVIVTGRSSEAARRDRRAPRNHRGDGARGERARRRGVAVSLRPHGAPRARRRSWLM